MSDDWKFWVFLITLAFNAGIMVRTSWSAVTKCKEIGEAFSKYVKYNEARVTKNAIDIQRIDTRCVTVLGIKGHKEKCPVEPSSPGGG